jgi:FkbM family methyltransferase
MKKTITFNTSTLKFFLKKIPILVDIKRCIWRLSNPHRPKPTLADLVADKTYFLRLFSRHQNLKSISFEKGIVGGSFRKDSFLLNIRPQNYIESSVYLNGVWEPHIAELIASYLNVPNAAVIDVGANIGATSIPLAKHFTEVRFFLFEPHPIIFSDLRNNISFNKLSNIDAFNIAITNHSDSFLPFYAQKNAKNFGQSAFTLNHDIEDYDVIQVECKTLDSVFNGELQLKVIKIDTQGHELNVLLSAKQLISKFRPVIIFEFESGYFESRHSEIETKENILKFFDQLNYELYMIENDNKFFPKVTLKDFFNGDILAVPLHNN